MLDEIYPPDVFGSSKFYVLEIQKIGQRNYPTKYVVLYETGLSSTRGFGPAG
jgi:hypothetical protein